MMAAVAGRGGAWGVPHLLRDRDGVAAVETALVMSFMLVPLLALLAGSGLAMQLQYRVDRALHAALIYSWGTSSGSLTAANISAAAQDAYGTGGPALNAGTPTFSYYCIDPTGTRSGVTAVTSSTTCSGGEVLAKYVTVSLSTSFTPAIGINWGTAAWTLTSGATVRVPN